MALILLVEDSPTERSVISSWLSRLGHQVIDAETAEDGLVQASRRQPDAILMDVVLPGRNGFEATRSLKKQEDTCHIPVVLISTKAQATDVMWGKRQGAAHYLTKPFDQVALAAALAQAGIGS